MSDQQPQLVIFSDDADAVAFLKQRFQMAQNMMVVSGNGPSVTSLYKLDALWMSPMQASYFGVTEPLPKHIGRVFPMPQARRDKGLPRYLITGAVMTPDDPNTPRFAATLCANALASALAEHNQKCTDRILRVGSIPGNLRLDSAEPAEAILAIRNAFADNEVHALQNQKTKQFA